MRPFLLMFLLAGGILSAQTENSSSLPTRTEYEKHVPPLGLRKLIDAAVLMLEARAYEQFIRTFVPESDRGKFEKAYTREGGVDYALWGQEKGSRLLTVLRSLGSAEAWVSPTRVCYFPAGESKPLLSFIQVRSMWLIENSSRCPERKPAKSMSPPAETSAP
ncbi:MAG: hypothetical protein ACOY5B_00005 [Spirochaetota bacterium]